MFKNKILSGVLAFFLVFSVNLSFGEDLSNRDMLLGKINTLEKNLSDLRINKTSELEEKVILLSNTFDESFESLGYDNKTIEYLVSMGKISSNFKLDLSNELTSLTTEIATKTNTELSSLNSIKNNILLNYSTVSDSQKNTFLNSISNIESNYEDLSENFSLKTTNLNNKYTSLINDYKTNLRTVVETNQDSINFLNNFSKEYDKVFSLNNIFDENYKLFRDTYLSFAGELTNFSEEKQKSYVDRIRGELEKIRDTNIEANKSLENYKPDINRFIDILIENFETTLFLRINNSYGILYSEADVNSVISSFNTISNRYYDLEGKMKPNQVLSNTGSLFEVTNLYSRMNSINNTISNLIGENPSTNTLSNVKIRLENEMIRFYNENYSKYRDDLLLKLREKLTITSLETKNIIAISEIIDIRYQMLSDKLKASTIEQARAEIKTFNNFVGKYYSLNSDVLTSKISRLDNNLEIYLINRELALPEFSRYTNSTQNYISQLEQIFIQLESRYPNTYKEKLNIVLSRIDALSDMKINTKTRHMLIVVKLGIYNHLNK